MAFYFNRTSADLNNPPAIVQPAETEQERDLRQFKEEYALGKKHLASSTAILNRIFERGEWQKDGLAWGRWAEEKAGVDKSHAYAMVRVKNSATEALKKYYQDQSVSSTSGSAATTATTTCGGSSSPSGKRKKKSDSSAPTEGTSTQAGSSPAQPAVGKGSEPSAPQPPEDNHKPEPKPPMDASGALIPQNLLKLVQRSKEVTEAAYWASKLKCLFERLQTEQDPIFSNLQQSGNVQTFMNGAASMHHALAQCAPEIVCPVCDGTGLHDHTDHRNGNKLNWCYECCGNGLICEVRWNRDWVKSNDRIKQSVVAKRAENLCC